MPSATPVRPQYTTKEGLVRAIRRLDLVLLVLNAIVGAGIFGLPAQVFAATGFYSLFAYLVCAVLVSLIILCFAEVGSRFQDTGGPYLYAHAAFGQTLGFEMGWLLWLARLTACAALSNLWVSYLGFFWPGVASGTGRAVTITAIVLAFTILNVRGVRGSTVFNDVLTVTKLTPLVPFVRGRALLRRCPELLLRRAPDRDRVLLVGARPDLRVQRLRDGRSYLFSGWGEVRSDRTR
jgi:amino acid transporter